MHNIWGAYTEVEFSDGSHGAYAVAQQYYRNFEKLRVASPEKFSRICDSVLGDNPSPWNADERRILDDIGLSFAVASQNLYLMKTPEAEVRQFIKLAVRPTDNRVVGGMSAYDLQSPFKHPVPGAPDQVAEQNRQEVHFEWSGTDLRNCPGKFLITQSVRRVGGIPQLQPCGM